MTSPHWSAIFDWDGVILDSSRQHEESWERLAHETGRSLPPDHFKRGFGMKNEKIIPELLGWTRDAGQIHQLSLRKEALYRDVVVERGVTPLPGVREWLQALKQASIPCVIASSTHRLNITTVLQLLGFTDFFLGMITAENVSHGKPHPEVFLKAAELAETAPSRCAVFEDALVGIRAGHAAGMKVIGVATTHPARELAEADRVVHRLDELRVEDLERWLQSDEAPRSQAVKTDPR